MYTILAHNLCIQICPEYDFNIIFKTYTTYTHNLYIQLLNIIQFIRITSFSQLVT